MKFTSWSICIGFFYTGMEVRAEKIEVRQAEETMAIIAIIIRMPFSFFGF